ncbi:RIP metalloprotease RseP [Natronospora cellulosivora (SeqCode)]
MVTIIAFIVVLGILVFIHEFGHYISAKLAGIRVEEFALGFGPKLIGFTRGDTLYSIRIVPLGGFCKMTGEAPPDESMSEEEKKIYIDAREKGQTFDQKPLFHRFAVIFNGPLMNFVLAIFIFLLIYTIYGVPVERMHTNVIGDVHYGTPAAEAGLRPGDRIIEMDGHVVEDWHDVNAVKEQLSGETITIRFERNNELRTIEVEPIYNQMDDSYLIGISQQLVRQNLGFFRSLRLAFLQTWYFISGLIIGIIGMIRGTVPADIGGPVMIASVVGQAADIGLISLLNLTAFLSINLGLLNLLPFPALDGGRLVFLFIELLRGKPVSPEKENMVHIVGFFILITFMVFVIIKDIQRFF